MSFTVMLIIGISLWALSVHTHTDCTIMPDNIKSNVTAAATTTKIIVVGPVICVCVWVLVHTCESIDYCRCCWFFFFLNSSSMIECRWCGERCSCSKHINVKWSENCIAFYFKSSIHPNALWSNTLIHTQARPRLWTCYSQKKSLNQILNSFFSSVGRANE